MSLPAEVGFATVIWQDLNGPDGSPASGTVTFTPDVTGVLGYTGADGSFSVNPKPYPVPLASDGTLTAPEVFASNAGNVNPSNFTITVTFDIVGFDIPPVTLDPLTPGDTYDLRSLMPGVDASPGQVNIVGTTGPKGDKGDKGNTGATGATSPPSGVAGGDLAGTYPNPTVATVGGAAIARAARQIATGTGLTGGGDLTADRTLAADFGTAAGKVAQGNDARFAGSPAGTASAALSATDPAVLGPGFPSTYDPALGTPGTYVINTSTNQTTYFRVRDGGTIDRVYLKVYTSSGTISVAAYSNSGTGRAAVPGTRLATSGSVACPSATTGGGFSAVTLGSAVTLKPGDWLAISASTVTAQFGGISDGASSATGIANALGAGRQYTQAVHPAPTTPASLVASTGFAVLLVGSNGA